MSWQSDILIRFNGTPKIPATSSRLLLDLTLWHKWHSERSSLPSDFGSSLHDSYRALGVAIWAPFRPWQVEYDGIDVVTQETAETHDIRYHTQHRTLTARWTCGPDGDWWQVEYPVKSADDLAAAEEVAAARRYVIDASGLDAWRAAVGQDGVTPLELPMRPYSDLLHTLLGWGEGLLLMQGEGRSIIGEILSVLELKLQSLASQVAALPGDLLLAPDNLDGQYISPRVFREHLAPSYAATVASALQGGKALVVHIGGPARRLVPLLAEAGVAGLEGIAGPPQSDVSLADARAISGPDVTLWGGIPQDLLIVEHEEAAFEAAVATAVEQLQDDSRVIIGVADRVPVNAEISRLETLVRMTR